MDPIKIQATHEASTGDIQLIAKIAMHTLTSESMIRDMILSIRDGIVKEAVDAYWEKNSAEILSKIKADVISNLASIELGKRAVKETEKKS